MSEKDKKNKYYATDSGSRKEIKYQDQNNSSVKLEDITEVSQTEFSEKKIDYTLEKNGSNIEKKSLKLFIKKHFPNYEDFWIRFVVPRTNRPKDIGMKDGLELIEQKLISFQYSIIHNLYYVAIRLQDTNNLDRETFEICYVRLSSAIDSCESFLFWFLILDDCKNPKEEVIDKVILSTIQQLFNAENKKNEIDKINHDLSKYVLSKFNNDRAPPFNLINKQDIILHFAEKKKIENNIKKFYKFIEDIRKYRNIIIHSWPLMEINNKFPKRKFVLSLKDWLEIDQKLRNNEKKILDKFDDMKNIISSDFIDFLVLINNIWEKIVI